MNKTCDFIASSFCGGGIGYLIGFIWFSLSEINTANAILMLAGLTLVLAGAIVALIGGAVWTVRHVRITII